MDLAEQGTKTVAHAIVARKKVLDKYLRPVSEQQNQFKDPAFSRPAVQADVIVVGGDNFA